MACKNFRLVKATNFLAFEVDCVRLEMGGFLKRRALVKGKEIPRSFSACLPWKGIFCCPLSIYDCGTQQDSSWVKAHPVPVEDVSVPSISVSR